MPSPWKIDPQEAAKLEAARKAERDAEADRRQMEMAHQIHHAKKRPVPQHVRDMLAVIAPDYDPDLPDEDD